MNNQATGYPSIDKPWIKHYGKTPIRQFDVNQKFYRLIETANNQNLETNALEYMGFSGNTWTYKELFALVDQMADAFTKSGVKPGDVVLVATVSGVDEAVCLLALNKIGAVSKWIDVTYSSGEIKKAIEEHSCSVVVAFAVLIPELMKCLDETKVKTVIYSAPDQFFKPLKILKSSLSEFKQLIQMKKASDPLPPMPSDSRFIRFDEFLKHGDRKPKLNVAKYEKDAPALIITSSGTTGAPKSIVHTDYSVNHSIIKESFLDFLFPGKVLFKIAPSWVGYGLINSLAVGLAYGMTVLLDPRMRDDIIMRHRKKFDVVYGVPLHYRYMSEHISEIDDLSRPVALISGGDKITAQEIRDIQNAFATKGSKAPILNGAGNNEILGAGTVNLICANKPGSIGLPMYGDIVSIFDPETEEELQYNQVGEICYNTESAFMEYSHDPEKTKQVKRQHKDGRIWIHSGDLGSIDEDGFVTIVGRLTRVITVNAFKVSASHIEEVIESYPDVKECVVVGVPDPELSEVPMANIVLKDRNKDQGIVQEEIKQLCQTHLKEYAVPKYYNFMDSIPYTSNNKQDYRKLEQIDRQIIGDQ